MSNAPIAFLRKSHGHDEIAKLAEEHLQHDLWQSDRDALRSAVSSVSTGVIVGSLIGVATGVALGFRVRSARTAMFNAFRAKEKPVKVLFEDGRSEAIPNIEPMLKPTTLGDFATYFFFSAGGLFIGGELGFLAGSYSASRTITQDPQSRARIETAFRKLRADVLRKEADAMDGGVSVVDKLFK